MLKIIAFLILMTFGPRAYANYLLFGADDNVYPIEGFIVHDSSGYPMQLAHRVSQRFFIAGIFVVDEGYVFIDPQNPWDYFTPRAEMLKAYQNSGALPKPLPSYHIPLWDYILGYSLWIIVGGMILFYWIKDKFFPNEEQPAPPTSTKPV